MTILSQLPVQQLFDGISGRVQDGPGDKVLWLHGYTLDSSVWGELWRRLPGWKHIGIDFPGHGGSEPITQAGRLPELAKRIGQYCVEEDIRRIVALSFGTITAIQINIEFPQHFDSVCLGAPSLAGGPEDPEVDQLYSQLYRIYYESGVGPKLREHWLGCKVWDGTEQFPGMREAIETLVEKHPWEELGAYSTMINLTQPPQLESHLQPIEASTLVVIGEHEMPPFKECTRILSETMQNCRVNVLQGAGHLCMLQCPAESAELIDQHLRSDSV